MMATPIELLAKVVDDPLRSPMGLRWNGDIYAGDLSDLHVGHEIPFYTRKKLQQVLVRSITASRCPELITPLSSVFLSFLQTLFVKRATEVPFEGLVSQWYLNATQYEFLAKNS